VVAFSAENRKSTFPENAPIGHGRLPLHAQTRHDPVFAGDQTTMSETKRIGFIGLGNMGTPMAANRPAAEPPHPAGSRDQYPVAQGAALTGAGNAAAPASSAAVA
jgi:hypothetical protein